MKDLNQNIEQTNNEIELTKWDISVYGNLRELEARLEKLELRKAVLWRMYTRQNEK